MVDDIQKSNYTKKQMGDACEMLVAVELTLAGAPALKVPDLWPGYDVIAQPSDRPPQRISVKSRTFKDGAAFVEYHENDSFDWLAIVILHDKERQIYIIPREIADEVASKNAETTKHAYGRYWRIDEVQKFFLPYKENFSLSDNKDFREVARNAREKKKRKPKSLT